ncbi:recombinase family protein [Sphingomonas sp.]|jgi:DNA invertase Pin-like site-specific DNA recombinase|uniref:recombinase family protein n=1 Tax=Sphingomonas sp. TaxID=28214 RepID=UPI002E2FEE7D|nr:recombinase family protein [Sphingomonas sp.]HEX4694442.1 recombinase family protein [Sphingomonas sp.]
MAKPGPRTEQRSAGIAGHVRCAIYTRKSTEEGLDQEFNSLDAQHEACAAYILSQRHEGWVLLPGRYDDGGFSGGTMDRPALKRLLADVNAGQIDVIVVYKVGRLTRALSDFSKIVEVLDAANASFVSIAQAFNTTSSMGRLTLNVLLSFAQFEREVTGARVRDKIAASKKKGMWMGGPVPLGYDVRERKLVVNENEAQTVRLIFERHQTVQTLRALADDLRAKGVRSKQRTMRNGRVTGGCPYRAGTLLHLLRNQIYLGKIRHGEHVYAGEHEAVIRQDIWEGSQELLNQSAARPRTGQTSLLAGRLFDAEGRPLMSAHAIKGQKRYRYYVSRPADAAVGEKWRLPAGDLESIVAGELERFLRNPSRVNSVLGDAGARRDTGMRIEQAASGLAQKSRLNEFLRDLDAVVSVSQGAIEITLDPDRLAKLLVGRIEYPSTERLTIRFPATLKRIGHELRLVYLAADARPRECDERLIRLVANGWAAWEQLRMGPKIADATKRSHLTRLARLRFLAPDIVTAIVNGRQPVELTSRSLLRISELPLAWSAQREVLGFN